MNFKKIILAAFALAFALVLTSCGSKENYKVSYTDGDLYEEAVLPVKTVDGAYAWNMMGMTNSTVTLSLDGETYSYLVDDITVEDEKDGMHYHKIWEWKGTYTKNGNKVTLDKPTECNLDVTLGSTFAEYKDIWGESGEYTQADEVGAKALERWEGGVTAVLVGEDQLSFE